MIDLEQVLALTEGYAIGHTIKYTESTPSTMALAKSYVETASLYPQADGGSLISGTIFVTEKQTAGRGRSGRGWETPHGKALLLSVIVQHPHLPKNPAQLAMIAGLAAARAIEKFLAAPTAHVQLKWPNDLLLALRNEPAQAGRLSIETMGKVGGVLIEAVLEQGRLDSAIIGIGINVNQTKDQLPPTPFGAPKATSTRLYKEKAMDRTELLAYLCEELSALLTICDGERDAEQSVYQAWRRRIDTLDRQVSIYERVPDPAHVARHTGDEQGGPMPIFSGRAVDVTVEGSLVIEDQRGERRSFYSGDVSVRY